MITEEQILRKIDDTDIVLRSLRGKPNQQQLERRKRREYLQGIFQQDTQMMLNLFWKLFEEGTGHYEEIFLAIIDSNPHIGSPFTDGPKSKAIELACQIMMKSNDHLREEAAKFLFDVKDPVAVPYLIEGLKSDDYNVVSRSAEALGNIGDARAEPYLIAIVDKYDNDEVYSDDRIDDEYPIIRANTFDGLCLLDTSGARQKILASLFHDRDPDIQKRAIRYLVAKMPSEAIPYLEKLTQYDEKEIAEIARYYLNELRSDH